MDMIGALREQYPQTKIVVIGDQVDLDTIKRGLAAGLNGFCLTSSGREILIKSLEMVMLGETVLPSTLVCSMLNSPSWKSEPGHRIHAARSEVTTLDPRAHKLSTREAEILECLMEGAPNKVIARRFDVAEATVKVHVKAILRKIGAANRTQAAIWATEHLTTRVEARVGANN
jgi:two-component system nitrate/nitrite response regulator NarL